MADYILPAFITFPNEASIIGRLLAGHSELELNLLNCVSMARDDLDICLKAMFRSRNESARIQIADALGRQEYRALGLETEFSMAIGAVRYCTKIRNTYAHCVWYDDISGQLAYVNLEELSDSDERIENLNDLEVRYVNETLLKQQEEYFVYTRHLLRWTNWQGRKAAGKLTTHPFAKPKAVLQPPLHLP